MGTLVVGTIVLVLVVLAGRNIYKDRKSGKCCGDCAHCGGACHQGQNDGK